MSNSKYRMLKLVLSGCIKIWVGSVTVAVVWWLKSWDVRFEVQFPKTFYTVHHHPAVMMDPVSNLWLLWLDQFYKEFAGRAGSHGWHVQSANIHILLQQPSALISKTLDPTVVFRISKNVEDSRSYKITEIPSFHSTAGNT